MVGIVIVTHGELADGLLDAARAVAGRAERCTSVCLREGDSVEELGPRIASALDSVDDGDGVFVLVDMWGASPFNSAAVLALRAASPLEVIAGVNLPMVLELLVQRDAKGFEGLTAIALTAGRDGIRGLSQAMQDQEDR